MRCTQRAYSEWAAISLPSFRSPHLCNYDFTFMDINYIGCLAVSLHGILIQGCGHNGTQRCSDLTVLLDPLLTCLREKRRSTWWRRWCSTLMMKEKGKECKWCITLGGFFFHGLLEQFYRGFLPENRMEWWCKFTDDIITWYCYSIDSSNIFQASSIELRIENEKRLSKKEKLLFLS